MRKAFLSGLLALGIGFSAAQAADVVINVRPPKELSRARSAAKWRARLDPWLSSLGRSRLCVGEGEMGKTTARSYSMGCP
jgi:hypothetical protein